MVKCFDLFLSHHSADKPWALRLKRAVEERGLTVWLDRDEIRPGDQFVAALEAGLEQSRAVALVASPGSLRSGWVREEYSRALALTHDREPTQLIPLLLRDVELPGFLASRSWIDFRDEARFEPSVDQLIWGITGRKPSGRPLKRHALLDRRLAAEMLLAYPPKPSRRVDAASQHSYLYALSLFEQVLIEDHYGSIMALLVRKDELLRNTVLFINPAVSSHGSAEVESATVRSWAGDPGFQVVASRYGRTKGNTSQGAAQALAYPVRMMALARHYDAAIVPHPDRWPLYRHIFDSAPSSREGRTMLTLPAVAAEAAVSPERAEHIRRVAASAPGPTPIARLFQYERAGHPLPAGSESPEESRSTFTYELCAARPPELAR